MTVKWNHICTKAFLYQPLQKYTLFFFADDQVIIADTENNGGQHQFPP